MSSMAVQYAWMLRFKCAAEARDKVSGKDVVHDVLCSRCEDLAIDGIGRRNGTSPAAESSAGKATTTP